MEPGVIVQNCDAFCDELSSVSCQVYHGEGNLQEAHMCGLKIKLSLRSLLTALL
jgi:hypothetical protein